MVSRSGASTCEHRGDRSGETVGKSSVESRPVDTLYYDGQCPLCASEIKALAEVRGTSLSLVDIHQQAASGSIAGDGGERGDAGTDGEHDPGVDDLLRTLHLQRADGTWLTGADANVAAWEGTRRGRMLRVLRWPILRPLVDLGYRIWALWRYRRLYGRQFKAERHAP